MLTKGIFTYLHAYTLFSVRLISVAFNKFDQPTLRAADNMVIGYKKWY